MKLDPKTRAAKAAIEELAQAERDPGRANMAIGTRLKEKLAPRGITRGYTYETIRRARQPLGTVGPELYAALLQFFDLEENEAEFLQRFAGAKPPQTRKERIAQLLDEALELRPKARADRVQAVLRADFATGEPTLQDVLGVLDGDGVSIDAELEREHVSGRGGKRRR